MDPRPLQPSPADLFSEPSVCQVLCPGGFVTPEAGPAALHDTQAALSHPRHARDVQSTSPLLTSERQLLLTYF